MAEIHTSTRNNIHPKLPKSLRKLFEDPRVCSIDDESANGDGYWIYYIRGWRNPDIDCHFTHEWNVRDTLKSHKAVVPCHCDQCTDEEED